jgi:hypothetical protein
MNNINIKNNKENTNVVLTTQPILTTKLDNHTMEWGRTEHVYQTFGIKRGTLYNLFGDKLIEGKELRIRGKLKGVRIWNMDSIRRFIDSQPSEVGQAEEQKNATLN